MPSDGADDVEAIRRLKARYFRSLDTQDWQAFRSVFTDEAEIDVSADGAGVVRGSDAITESIARALDGATTVHQGTTPEIEVDGDEAVGTWAMTDLIVFPDGTRLDGAGHYHERYRRVDGRWRIAGFRLSRLRRELTPPS
jgi:uncharacterized protein (TIGR02246 family)